MFWIPNGWILDNFNENVSMTQSVHALVEANHLYQKTGRPEETKSVNAAWINVQYVYM